MRPGHPLAALALLTALLNSSLAPATEVSNLCLGAKVRGTAKCFTCRLRERVKKLRGKSADLARCDQKLIELFDAADARGGCSVTGDAGAALAQVAQAEAAVLDAMDASSATESELRCVIGKTKLLSRYALCQAESLAKRVYGNYMGLRLDFAACLETLDFAFADLESKELCPVTGEAALAASAAGGGYGYIPSFDWGSYRFSGYHQASANHVVLPNARMTDNDLQYIVADGADFSGSDLTGSNLEGVYGSGADFSGANLAGTNLLDAYLRGASFVGADFSGADLTRANLRDTTLLDATLATSDLTSIGATNIVGCPNSLPPAWRCGGGCLAGPTAMLDFGDIGAADFSGIDLTGSLLYVTTFHETNLAGAVLAGVNAHASKFFDADLTGADMTGIDLRAARISGTDLTGASMSGALLNYLNATNLTGCPSSLPDDWACVGSTLVGPMASLQEAALSNVDLSGRNLQDSVFRLADLSGANLAGANLAWAILAEANLSNANLEGADLRWAELPRADLSGVDLSTADLYMVHATALAACPAVLPAGWACLNQNLIGPHADLEGADLAGLDLRNMDLSGVYFGYSDCTGTLFAGATLADVQWLYTTCPDGYRDYGWCCEHLLDLPAICTE